MDEAQKHKSTKCIKFFTGEQTQKLAATGGGKMSTSSTGHASLFGLQKDNKLSSLSPGDKLARARGFCPKNARLVLTCIHIRLLEM